MINDYGNEITARDGGPFEADWVCPLCGAGHSPSAWREAVGLAYQNEIACRVCGEFFDTTDPDNVDD